MRQSGLHSKFWASRASRRTYLKQTKQILSVKNQNDYLFKYNHNVLCNLVMPHYGATCEEDSLLPIHRSIGREILWKRNIWNVSVIHFKMQDIKQSLSLVTHARGLTHGQEPGKVQRKVGILGRSQSYTRVSEMTRIRHSCSSHWYDLITFYLLFALISFIKPRLQ